MGKKFSISLKKTSLLKIAVRPQPLAANRFLSPPTVSHWLGMALLALILSSGGASATYAAPPSQDNAAAQFYTMQAEDTLPRLAEKYYRDASAWPAIWQATQAGAATEPDFAPPDNPYVIRPGQPLLIPAQAEVEQLRAEYSDQAGFPMITPPSQMRPVGAAWLAEFRAYTEEARQHFGIPGAALALVRHNQIVLAQGFGVRELGQAAPVTPETVFGIGSTTKAMNSLLIAALVEEGLLDWDQAVVDIWPDFKLSDPAVTPQIRVRDLLNMGSGLPRADLAWSGVGLTAEGVMESLAALPVVAPPGQRFQYNNQMVATGGYVAALAAGGDYGQLGQAYAGLMQRRVFDPIGMRSASLSIEAAQANPNHAMPHDFTLAGQILPTYYHDDPGIEPAGAVNANVLDLARFLLTQLNYGVAPNGQRVVSAQRLAETWQPQLYISTDTHYALGWFVEDYEGVEMLWHDGDTLGFKSLLVFIPEARLGLALLTNRTISVGFSSSLRYRLVEMAYGLEVEAGLHYKAQWDAFMEALPGIREPLEAAPAAAEVAPYLGAYQGGWQIEQREDGTLWSVRGPYHWQLLAAGQGNFVINNGFGLTSEIEFVTDEAEGVTMIVKLSTGESGEYSRLQP